ncbi:hypothetical protein P9112_004307 [Eukaryota sp. TZLM1-RC]
MSFPSEDIIEAAFPQKVHCSLVEQGLRRDGRDFLQRREMSAVHNCLKFADGSSLVKLHGTSALCSIKCRLASIDQAPSFSVSVSFANVCNSPDQPHLSSILNDLIQSYPPINLSSLDPPTPNHNWLISISITFLSSDGSELDAALHSINTAFSSLLCPQYSIKEDTGVLSRTGSVALTTLNNYLVSGTFVITNDKLLFDPTNSEIVNSDSLLQVVLKSNTSLSNLSDDVDERNSQLTLARCHLSSGSGVGCSLVSKAINYLREVTGV